MVSEGVELVRTKLRVKARIFEFTSISEVTSKLTPNWDTDLIHNTNKRQNCNKQTV